MKRILFVDDEPRVLEGLKRMLRSMRREWQMKFVPGGKEALAAMAEEPFDVVVSDMRMPGMDGAQLLAEARRLHPQTVRIVLSGHSDKEMVMRSVGPAHQYLAKPCNAKLLKEVVTRACALRDVLGNDELRRVVSQMQLLPSLPRLHTAMLAEIQAPDASPRIVGEIINQDVGMAAKVLQLVNSAFFGLHRHISDPAEAVTLLGLDTMRALVLSAHIFSQFEEAQGAGFRLGEFQNHSIGTGALAKQIAAIEQCDDQTCDHALMAGMLHDTGKLILAASYPDQYRQVLTAMRDDHQEQCTAERQVFGTSHAEVGAYLLGLWGLPDPIVETLAFHHCPGKCLTTGFTPLAAVHVANALEHEMSGPVKQKCERRLDTEFLAQIGVADHLPAWRELIAGNEPLVGAAETKDMS